MSNFAPTLNLLEVPGERQKYSGPHAFPLRARQMCQDDKTPCIFGPGSCGSCRESTQSHSDIVRDVGHICTKPWCMCAFKYMRIHMHCTKLYSVKLMSGYRFYRNQALEVGFEETLYPLPNPAGCPATRCPGLSMRDLAGNFHAAQETSPSSHRQAASRSATWAVPTCRLEGKGHAGTRSTRQPLGHCLKTLF